MEQVLKSIMDKLDEVNKRLDNLDATMKSLDARVSINVNSKSSTLGDTMASLGEMRLG